MGTPPTISYPPELPITDRVDEIAAAIRDHQVVVVAGETGSGKTTQLPKICLQLGRGADGMIGHTQPRRLAARSVADRVAAELATPLGGVVGYQVRFTDQVGPDTMVKLMTDGILLAELSQDRQLRRYDTLIIDEAHERSLNVDFLLGYLTTLLPRRPDLKLVVTSATIDPHRFAAHFDGAPVVEVSGRTYPVEIRYRPPEDPEVDQAQAVCDAVDELAAEGPGDILVFLSGEREIRDTADALQAAARRGGRGPRAGRGIEPDTEILPLYARLSLAEQHRVFQSHAGRRIVLATNVAETSLTVPGIRYVVDPGTARISRYSHRLKVQRLPIEPVSQASAVQRAGRCGRLSGGVCIRLYAQPDFESRPAYPDPEVLRTNLASVILQLSALRLGEVADFPFLDPPDRRQVTDGVRLLTELGALDGQGRLTGDGRKLARLPVDPRLGRMVLEAGRTGCLREVTVIAAALAIQDPRERPADRREEADARHARFTDPGSDFLSYLNLWRYLQEQQQARSSSQFRRMCRAEHLNYLRVREWQDVRQQLLRVARTVGAGPPRTGKSGGTRGDDEPDGPGGADQEADPQRIHTALLAGLLSHVGVRDLAATDPRRRREYRGARGSRFAISPGSALFGRTPEWVMVAELVETSRLWGRFAAAIAPEWVERLAGHLVKRSYRDPYWDRDRGEVVGYEQVTLYGIPLVTRRPVSYRRVDPALARELFIRHALVAGDWDTRHPFLHDNQALVARVEELEHRARRRDLLADDEVRFDFYDQRIPAEVTGAAEFDRWWKRARRDRPDLLTFPADLLLDPDTTGVAEQDYPGSWRHGGHELPLTYQFAPGEAADGVTVHIPLPLLDEVAGAGFDWQVPGLRRELVVALVRSLPKPVRRGLVPVPEVAGEALAQLTPYQEPLTDALARALRATTGVLVPPAAWAPEKVPGHLRMTIRVTGPDGEPLAEGKNVAALREQLLPAARASLSAAAAGVERRGLRDWPGGDLPRRVTLTRGGHPVTAYPALVDTGDAVDLRACRTVAEQAYQMPRGTRRLLLLTIPSPAGYVSQRLSREAKVALLRNPHGGVRPLLADCAGCAVDALVAEHGGPAWDEAGFAALRQRVRGALDRATLGVVTEALPIVTLADQLDQRLAATGGARLAPAVADLREQLAALAYPGCLTDLGWQRLPDLRRWLRAAAHRLDKLPADPPRDARAMATVQQVQQEYARLRADLPVDAATADATAVGATAAAGTVAAGLDRVRWMIEELRVSLFAQQLGTAYPVSPQRVHRALDQLAASASHPGAPA